MWSADAIVAALIAALRDEEARLVAEQGHRGIDALDEVDLHRVLAAGLSGSQIGAGGCGVLREQPYPAEWRRKRGKRRPLPDDPDRLRCDLVLTPYPGQTLADELAARRADAARIDEASGTLFHAAAQIETPSAAEGVEPGDAFWLELKVVGQYCYINGVPSPNGRYASTLVRGVGADIRKLRDDPAILHAAAAVVLFTADRAVADHDLVVLGHRLADAHLPIRAPIRASLAIPDRIGNTCCTVWMTELASA